MKDERLSKNTVFLKRSLIPIKKFGSANEDNYFIASNANFTLLPKDFEGFKPNHKSNSGSQYMTTDEGLYRKSDHWGIGIASCNWMIEGCEYSKKHVSLIGFVKWDDIVPYYHSRGNMEAQQDCTDYMLGKISAKECVSKVKATNRVLDEFYVSESERSTERAMTPTNGALSIVSLLNQIGYVKILLTKMPDADLKRNLKKQLTTLEKAYKSEMKAAHSTRSSSAVRNKPDKAKKMTAQSDPTPSVANARKRAENGRFAKPQQDQPQPPAPPAQTPDRLRMAKAKAAAAAARIRILKLKE